MIHDEQTNKQKNNSNNKKYKIVETKQHHARVMISADFEFTLTMSKTL